jgi:hypothetical protein
LLNVQQLLKVREGEMMQKDDSELPGLHQAVKIGDLNAIKAGSIVTVMLSESEGANR